jgi:hypothetical protein
VELAAVRLELGQLAELVVTWGIGTNMPYGIPASGAVRDE